MLIWINILVPFFTVLHWKIKIFGLKFNENIQNFTPRKTFRYTCCVFLCRILCLYIFILHIFSITGQCCYLLKHLNLLSPTECTYSEMYGYHLKFVCFLLNTSTAQNALEYWAFQWIFWYYLQQLSHIHWLKCVHYDMIDLKETKVPPCKFRWQISHKYLLPYITLLSLPSWRLWALSCKQIIGCNCSYALKICSVLAIAWDHTAVYNLYNSTKWDTLLRFTVNYYF